MNYIQFTLVRLASIPVALLFAFDWALLPSNLQIAKSTEQVVSAKYGKVKGHEIAFLQTQASGELRVQCRNAGQLCAYLQRTSRPNLKVWLQEPALFHGPWVVAADDQGTVIVKPEDNMSAYREFKIVWAVVAAILAVVAFVSWYFAPFNQEVQNAP